jgi:type IV pilus assembly protein PilN
MRGPWIPVNLSTEKFRQDRVRLIVSMIAAALLVIALAVQTRVILRERDAARNDRETLARLDTQLRSLDADYNRLAAQLRQPASTVVIERSAFLNVLLQRKGISWTRLFADLEEVFPPTVRLVAVRPYLTADNQVQLDMVVGAASPEPLIQLIQKLEGSPVFGATSLLNSQPPSQNEPLHRLRVSVSYAQKL